MLDSFETQNGRRVAQTSKEIWEQLKESGKPQKENRRVLKFLNENDVQTSRMIAVGADLERTSATRCIRSLQDQGLIHIVKKDNCPTTGVRVRWYSVSVVDNLSLADLVRQEIPEAPTRSGHPEYFAAVSELERADPKVCTAWLHDHIAKHPTLSHLERTCLHKALTIKLQEKGGA